MKANKCIKVGVVILSVIFSIGIFAQDSKNHQIENWARLSSESGEFSILIPANGVLVDKEDKTTRIYFRNSQLSLTVGVTKKSSAKGDLRNRLRFPMADMICKAFDVREFLVSQCYSDELKSAEIFEMGLTMTIASDSYEYYIRASSKDKSEADDKSPYRLVVASLQLKNKSIFANSELKVAESKIMSFSELVQDDVVTSALKQPDSKQKKLEDVRNTTATKDDKVVYSRDLVILRKPRASYTESGRQNNISGTVKLQVEFLSNGQIGLIRLISGLKSGLNLEAFEAARKIKFLPAEIDGKPVNVTREMEYSFTIY